jgi:FkbM family methyltransferase
MKYSSSSWKHKLRSKFYKIISPKLYIAIMPAYYKFFSKKRRGCTYKFKVEENKKITFSDSKTKFSFMGYRRMNRYLYPEGLERKMNSMKKKYCNSECNINAGDTVVEIGANVGEFTLMASNIAQKVFAFEPDPNCFRCLKENISSKNNIEIFESAASKENRSEVFYVSTEDADSSLIKPKIYTDEIEIKSVRLDSWMDSLGLQKIDFLKLEAEGAEIEVLEGLGEKIHFVRKISVDGGPERYGEPTSDDVDRFLQAKGFNTNVIGYHVYAWRNESE